MLHQTTELEFVEQRPRFVTDYLQSNLSLIAASLMVRVLLRFLATI